MRLVLAAALIVLAGPAGANEAACRDYIQASGEDRSLFDGFIFGFMSAKMEGRGPTQINAATARVQQMVGDYCRQKPSDPVQSVVKVFGDTVAKYGLDPLH